ncbi:Non-specific serine/threonine protein kinase protein [Dioscorea alata]|uniref:Non-specific serine/threonine protein kinase protein n=1 Tax=Dioscorea alata TaxID=55571 RepID=A0ACB7VJZ5_DIOAL|nr:Non-specific serine/threonine protein kinase protein [Dioscorea alata]
MESGRYGIFILILILPHSSTSQQEEDYVKISLITFLQTLSGNAVKMSQQLGWDISSNPCSGGWTGVICHNGSSSVTEITLKGYDLSGFIDAGIICKSLSLVVLSLSNNSLRGELPSEISNCSALTSLDVSQNELSGQLPASLSELKTLESLNLSNNNFSGLIPASIFGNLKQFDVSNNNFSGPVPPDGTRFSNGSYLGNAGLCGTPLHIACTSAASPVEQPRKKIPARLQILMYSGYFILGVAFLLLLVFVLLLKNKKRKKKTEEKTMVENYKEVVADSNGYNKNTSRSDYTTSSASLVLLKSTQANNGLRFDDLLKAPAELMGRGTYGSVYKVMLGDGTKLVVKRIKEWMISDEEFEKRMEMIDKVRHQIVLSAVAFYCSKQEKLLVYEFQQNGSLLKLLQDAERGRPFNWSSRLNLAAAIAEGLAFMHSNLQIMSHGIPHGNLKSSNILLNNNMEPYISEYGIMSTNNRTHPSPNKENNNKEVDMKTFKTDVYSFGMLLLELLTGKLNQDNGFELNKWVNSVVREEWTVEVFDKALIVEDDNQESMVHLLQVAVKCVDAYPDARPTMSQVYAMVKSIKEDEDQRSLASDLF